MDVCRNTWPHTGRPYPALWLSSLVWIFFFSRPGSPHPGAVEGKDYRQKIILYGGEVAGACLNRRKEALGPLACLLSTVALCQLSPLGPSWPKAAWDCDPVHTGVIAVRLSVMVMVMLMVMMKVR